MGTLQFPFDFAMNLKLPSTVKPKAMPLLTKQKGVKWH